MTAPWHPLVPMCPCRRAGCEHPVLVRWFALADNGQPCLTLAESCNDRIYSNGWKLGCSVQTCTHTYNLIPSELCGVVCVFHLLHAQKALKDSQPPAHDTKDMQPAHDTKDMQPAHDDDDDDVLFEACVKLSYWRGSKWTERGTGKLKMLMCKDDVRLVMRSGKQLLLNQLVRPNLTIGQSLKTIRVWTEYDGLEEPPVMRTFHAKFDTPELAEKFTDMMDVVRGHLGSKAGAVHRNAPAVACDITPQTTATAVNVKPQTAEAINTLICAVAGFAAQRCVQSEVTSIASLLANDIIDLQPELRHLFEIYGWNNPCRQFDGHTTMETLNALCKELESNRLRYLINQCNPK